ncbi:MAG: trypsin-like peptidase domain-containing protein [bacterium]|nr:trypsin-like peptidase domain-containing protein [bacterium]
MNHETEIIHAVEKILPSVVSIIISKHADAVAQTLPFPGMNTDTLPKDEKGNIKIGGGSGFIISRDGLVLTNKHVIADRDADYTIFDQDGSRSGVQVLARDPIHDVAILKMDPPKRFAVAPLGTGEGLRLGQTVIAIGNALGEFQSSVSTGVVSGLSRMISAVSDMSGHQERLRGLIQTDAAINPGNSGGPLMDIHGRVIGINSAVVFGAQNIGFAIPIEKAKRDLDDIKEHGHIRRPFLGIRYILVNKALQQHFSLPVDYGALIVKEEMPGDHAVVPGSPADKAGLKDGDLVLACNQKAITEKNSLEDILENTFPGDGVSLTFLRGNTKDTVKLTLEERPIV